MAVLTRGERMSDHWYLRPGWTSTSEYFTVHVTFSGTGLADRVAGVQRALATIPGLDVVPAQWLHLTLQGVGFVGEVDEQVLPAVVEECGTRLAGVAAHAVRFGPAQVHHQGILVEPAPVGPLVEARLAVRRALAAVLGVDQVPGDDADFWPHVSLAYAGGPVVVDDVLDGLAAADGGGTGGSGALVAVGELDLIRLRRDGHCYVWDPVARLRLGG